jgi:hypothetical protein
MLELLPRGSAPKDRPIFTARQALFRKHQTNAGDLNFNRSVRAFVNDDAPPVFGTEPLRRSISNCPISSF